MFKNVTYTISGDEITINGQIYNDRATMVEGRIFVVTHDNKDVTHVPDWYWPNIKSHVSMPFEIKSAWDVRMWDVYTLKEGWVLELRNKSGGIIDRWVPDMQKFTGQLPESIVEKAKKVIEVVEEKAKEAIAKQKRYIKCTLPLLDKLPGIPWSPDFPVPPGFERAYTP